MVVWCGGVCGGLTTVGSGESSVTVAVECGVGTGPRTGPVLQLRPRARLHCCLLGLRINKSVKGDSAKLTNNKNKNNNNNNCRVLSWHRVSHLSGWNNPGSGGELCWWWWWCLEVRIFGGTCLVVERR